ncbi:MAG: RluA family pseudouridine synthase [Myxococcales bacterium]|nr:RluA family pseudouridine synthase [Myxococcales bacterium]MCB9713134.1 RluA family pseudouridine synthase [Myxococcales bacterium]
MSAGKDQARAVVAPELDGQTVAAVVRSLLDGLPWSKARALCREGRVRHRGAVATDPAARVRAGDEIAVLHTAAPRLREPEIRLLHVDADVVVVDKPAGLVSVPFTPDERDTLLHRAHAALRRHEGGKHLPPLRVVQRLDKDTSGVMVLARTRRAERELGQQLRRHDVHRVYLGIAYGRVAGATHDTMLVPDRGDRRRGSWRPRGRAEPPAAARRAITHVELVEHHACADLRWAAARSDPPGLSLVRCRLETGRQHQIRIHLGEDHHPLVGERVYDRDYEGPRLHDFIEGRGRPMLHAAELGFRHPSRDLSLSFCADLPSDFADLLHRMRASGAR